MPEACETGCGRPPTRKIKVDVEGSDEFVLCAQCAERLEAHALRPLEWYNLARIHTPGSYHLHDDFYDDDGVANQPDMPVDDAKLFPAPTLDDVKHDLATLFDHCRSRHVLRQSELDAFRAFDPADVLAGIDRRIQEQGLAFDFVKIATHHPCERTPDWLRRVLDSQTGPGLGLPIATCVPFISAAELFDRAKRGATDCDPRQRDAWVRSLGSTRDPRVVDWIESNIESPTSNDWGAAAAQAGIEWPRLSAWLEHGRPRSLAALDALDNYFGDNNRRTPRPTSMNELAVLEQIRQSLERHVQRDPAPRVELTARRILAQIRAKLAP